jgi:hypothetical protein
MKSSNFGLAAVYRLADLTTEEVAMSRHQIPDHHDHMGQDVNAPVTYLCLP